MQVGIDSNSYGDYLTQSWRHLLPDSKRAHNLRSAANWLSSFDIVALQEVDAGSLRSQFVNQVEFLAHQGGFPHYYQQQNRKVAGLAAHSNGLLSKFASSHAVHHKLPGRIPGRGALQVTFDTGKEQILVLSVHLSLSHKARCLQLKYIAEHLKTTPYFIIMGDMNCHMQHISYSNLAQRDMLSYLQDLKQETIDSLASYPAWKPSRLIDHILVSPSIKVQNIQTLAVPFSDHLPIAIEVQLPAHILV